MHDLSARLEASLAQADALLMPARAQPALATAARLAWRGKWLETACRRWLTECADLDERLRITLTAIPTVLASAVAAGAEPWAQRDDPARQLAELAIGSLRGFDSFSGRRSDGLPQQIVEVLAATARADIDAAAGCRQLGEILHHHAQEVRPLEQQLIAKERQQRQQVDAMRSATRALQDHIGSHSLPDFAVEFFDGELRKLLQITHVQNGEASAQWRQLLTAIDSLVWALADAEPEALKTAYGNRVQAATQWLRDQLGSIHHNQEAADSFFDNLDFYLLSRLHGQTPSLPVLAWAERSEGDQAWTKTSDPLLKARALREGDWVALTLDSGSVRARLIEKDLQHGIYLFANLSGLRVARLPVEALANQFAEQTLRIVDARPMMISALPIFIEELENRILQLQLDAQQLSAQQRQQEASRLQREQAQLRALQAAALASQQAEREAQANAEAAARLLAECRQNCKRLQAGAWIELRREGSEFSAQLAVILNRTGELLFVDSNGRKILQADVETLAAHMMRGELRIRDYGRALDDALQQIVADNRQRMEEWR